MSLEQTISKGIMEAMKAKDTVRLTTLRNIKKYILEARTAAAGVELTDADVVRIISKLAKQGSDSAAVYTQQNRPDLAEEELAQVRVMQEFLPRQLSAGELTEAVKAIIAEGQGVALVVRSEKSDDMQLLEDIHRNLKTIAMPSGMLVGALLCRPIAALEQASHQMITPALIFLMLSITFCRVKVGDMRWSGIHLRLLLFQLVVSISVYLLLLPLNGILAQGAMICVLAPVAMAAVVIGGMLGADITTMAAYSLLCNMAIALVAPVVLSLVGNGACTFWGILARVAPLLILPFFTAQLCRWLLPRASRWIADHSQISFYLWLLSLTIIIGRTTSYILDLGSEHLLLESGLALVALAVCLLQFKVGRMVGRRYGDPAAGGQSLGQKNTVLAVWMAQSFLDPISSIAPTAYIVWQNFVNSYQIYKKDRETMKNQI